MSHRLLDFALVAVIAVACDDSVSEVPIGALHLGEGASAILTSDSSGVAVATYAGESVRTARVIRLSEAPTVSIGVAVGPDELQFASISDARRLSNGAFVVVDRNLLVVRMFDATGQFIREVGRVGEGPGEYRLPTRAIEGPEGVIGVWDFQGRRLSRFRSDGSLIATDRLDVRGIQEPFAPAFDSGGGFLAVWDDPGFPEPPEPGMYVTSAVWVHHLETESPDTIAAFEGGQRRISLPTTSGGPAGRLWSPRPEWHYRRLLAAAVPDGIWLSGGTSWSAQHRSTTNGAIDRIVRFDLPLEPFPDSLIGARPASEYPETLPPIREIFADATGRLWIGLLALPIVDLPAFMGSAVQEWIVLSPTGEQIVGRVILPPRSRPMYADDEGVLILVVGALDVPHLEWRTFEGFGRELIGSLFPSVSGAR